MYRLLIVLFGLVLGLTCNSQTPDTIKYNPVGVFHTPYTPYIGAPRQGILNPASKGEIEIFTPYQKALEDLKSFEYIIVIFHFSEVKSWDVYVKPPGSEHTFTLFATRSPKRPNPIGFSVIKLDSLVNGRLYVSGIDAFDGTPVLDIKPYLPSIDCIRSIQNSRTEAEFGHHNDNFIRDSSYYR